LDKNVKAGYDALDYTIRAKGDGTKEQFDKIHEWVRATSPNYWNMANAITMRPRIQIESR
jgi:hypothetical protein